MPLLLAAMLAAAPPPSPPRGRPAQEQQAEAIFSEAEALLRMGRVQQARERYERIVEEYPRARFPQLTWRAAARVRLGDIRWRSGSPELAGSDYVGVLEQEPPSAWSSRARLGLAGMSLAAGRWQEAVDLLARVVVAAAADSPEADAGAAAEARRDLTLVDRFLVGHAAGRPLWRRAERLQVPGLELQRPVALAAAPDGQLLIVDEGLPAVLLVDAEHGRVSRLPYNEHVRPWWGIDGLPYLPTRRAGVIALGGSHVGFLAREGGRPLLLKDLAAGTRTPSGRWYLLDASPPRVFRFGPEADYQGMAVGPPEEPVDLSTDPLGRLLVLERKQRAVVRFRADGRREGAIVHGSWRRPVALETDGLGNLYVLDRDQRTVDVFDADGERLVRLGPSLPANVPLRSPRDLAVDGFGRLYVADRGAAAVYVLE